MDTRNYWLMPVVKLYPHRDDSPWCLSMQVTDGAVPTISSTWCFRQNDAAEVLANALTWIDFLAVS